MRQAASNRKSLLERTSDSLAWLARRRGRTSSLPPHLALGVAGEDAAFFHLRRNGYRIVARRWSSGDVPGDLDLVAWHGPMLCFIEVKSRSEQDETPAEAAVDAHKRKILRRLARRYVRQLPQAESPPARFDVVSVYLKAENPPQIVHFESAFGWNEGRLD